MITKKKTISPLCLLLCGNQCALFFFLFRSQLCEWVHVSLVLVLSLSLSLCFAWRRQHQQQQQQQQKEEEERHVISCWDGLWEMMIWPERGKKQDSPHRELKVRPKAWPFMGKGRVRLVLLTAREGGNWEWRRRWKKKHGFGIFRCCCPECAPLQSSQTSTNGGKIRNVLRACANCFKSPTHFHFPIFFSLPSNFKILFFLQYGKGKPPPWEKNGFRKKERNCVLFPCFFFLFFFFRATL